MPINRKQEHLREIFMMVRRESVSFEPKDRVKLGLNARLKDGTPVSYLVGGVYYDFDSARLCFKMYNDRGEHVPARAGRFYLDERLTGEEMKAVSATVQEYSRKAVYRARNIAAIGEVLDTCDDRSLNLQEHVDVCIDRRRDGNMENVSVEGLFKEEMAGAIYLCAVSSDGNGFSYPFTDLSDMGVSNVLTAVERTVGRELVVNEQAKEKTAPARKHNNSIKM